MTDTIKLKSPERILARIKQRIEDFKICEEASLDTNKSDRIRFTVALTELRDLYHYIISQERY